MPSYLITGASRGIGLGVVEELLTQPENFVIATARNPGAAKDLQDLASKFPKDRLALITLDVSDSSSVEKAAKEAESILPQGLDTLILNAGVHHQPTCTFDDIDFKLLQDEMRYNTEYPIVLIRTFLPLIRKSATKKIAVISSELGTLHAAPFLPGCTNAYSICKAALNMTTRKYGALLKPEGITVFVLHPGWVNTDIGDAIRDWVYDNKAPYSQMTPRESGTAVVKVINNAKLEDTTTFWNYDGETRNW